MFLPETIFSRGVQIHFYLLYLVIYHFLIIGLKLTKVSQNLLMLYSELQWGMFQYCWYKRKRVSSSNIWFYQKFFFCRAMYVLSFRGYLSVAGKYNFPRPLPVLITPEMARSIWVINTIIYLAFNQIHWHKKTLTAAENLNCW